MITDEKLMQQYISGDYQAFEQLYRRYKSRVYGFLRAKVKENQIDDLFQQVFQKLHEKKHLYDVEYKFTPWFFTLIKHVVIDSYRKEKIDYVELAIEPEAPEENEASELELNINTDDEKLLFMKFVEQRGYKELAEEFNSNSSALRKRLSRLIAKIKGENHE